MISSGELNHPFVRDFDDSTTWGILQTVVPLINVLPDWALGKALANWRSAQDRTLKHAQNGIAQWRAHKEAGKPAHRDDILQRLIEHGERYPNEKLSEQELETEIMEIM